MGYLAAALAIMASAYAYEAYISGLGFPDGFISDLARTERGLATAFIAVSLVAGCSLAYLGHRHRHAHRHGYRHRPSRGALVAVLVLYASASAVIIVAGHLAQGRLMGGGGG